MTLAPIENRRVRGVSAERYPLNQVCAHPECDQPVENIKVGHHIFRRSAIGNDSWFVEITQPRTDGDGDEPHIGYYNRDEVVILPHVSGLCSEHHGDVTEHRAWIKLEDGLFVWYERNDQGFHEALSEGWRGEWEKIGALDPQPGGREKVHKPKRKKKEGDERRKRRTVSIRVPEDTEDGGAVWDETLEQTKDKLIRLGLYSVEDKIPNYEAVVAGLRDWLNDA